MFQQILLVLLVLVLQILSRFILLKRNTWLGKDSFYHLIVARYVRKEKNYLKQLTHFIKRKL